MVAAVAVLVLWLIIIAQPRTPFDRQRVGFRLNGKRMVKKMMA